MTQAALQQVLRVSETHSKALTPAPKSRRFSSSDCSVSVGKRLMTHAEGDFFSAVLGPLRRDVHDLGL
jgi:hypothetical protein